MVEYSNKNVKKLKEDIYSAMKDSGGKEPGMVGYVGPTVQSVPGNVCVASITETDLTDNVYTVIGEPATVIDGLRNNGPENITVTVANTGGNLTKVLKPNDVWDRDGLDFTTITFSAGAQFQADILR